MRHGLNRFGKPMKENAGFFPVAAARARLGPTYSENA